MNESDVMPDLNKEDRRSYFRLTEKLLMSYQRLDFNDNSTSQTDSDDLSMIKEFSTMTQQFKVSLSRINQRLPEVSSCFKLLDSKLNLMAESLYSQQDHAQLKRQYVNISAGGMSFVANEKLSIGERLEIKMVLSTDLINLNVMASVVDSLSKNDNFQVSVKFIDMSDPTQDLIVKHLMQSQSSLLRKDKT